MIVWKLDEVLRVKGVKGRELARRMEIGENYLSRVRHEVPDRLSLELLDGLCRELGCTIADLLEYQPAPGEVVAPIQPARRKAPVTPGKRAPRKPREAEAAEAPVASPPAPHAPPEAPAEVPEDDEDFEAILAAAFGQALEEPAGEASASEPLSILEPEAEEAAALEPEAAPETVEAAELEVPQTRWEAEPVPEATLPAPVEVEIAPVDDGLDVPQTRWSEEPVPEATLPADPGGAAVVRTSALGAKLGRLRKLRGQ